MDCGNHWNFNEYLRLTNNEVHVNPIWSEETLKTMSDFIKHSSKRVNMILACDGYCEIRERCVHFLSDCLGWTSSIRFSTGFNEKSFITMMELCQKYDGITGGCNLYKFVGLFGPLPNKMDFKDTSWISQVDFRFLQKYLNKDVTQWYTYSDSLSALDQFIIRTLFNISRCLMSPSRKTRVSLSVWWIKSVRPLLIDTATFRSAAPRWYQRLYGVHLSVDL
ncbi:uncharacterized protein LOC120517430 [Polypterus senegalus]|uniref:uncharacterized protein LOC120517430 n=1 Tax=Polypterus senegalus TaxID=55291 RepID=UPI001965B631|nr:uncharacterized protein LOC120517430 [Polypterus senegalus]